MPDFLALLHGDYGLNAAQTGRDLHPAVHLPHAFRLVTLINERHDGTIWHVVVSQCVDFLPTSDHLCRDVLVLQRQVSALPRTPFC